MNFTKIDYLKTGTTRQQHAYTMLTETGIMDALSAFSPVITGTIPIEIDIESSDLDIACCFDDLISFRMHLITQFSNRENFRQWDRPEWNACLCSFMERGMEVEIFGQPIHVDQQMSYRHMVAEYRILLEKGDDFRQQIMDLKRKGYKTEPAFGMLLGLDDPYQQLLDW